MQSAKCFCPGGATLLPMSAGWFQWRGTRVRGDVFRRRGDTRPDEECQEFQADHWPGGSRLVASFLWLHARAFMLYLRSVGRSVRPSVIEIQGQKIQCNFRKWCWEFSALDVLHKSSQRDLINKLLITYIQYYLNTICPPKMKTSCDAKIAGCNRSDWYPVNYGSISAHN